MIQVTELDRIFKCTIDGQNLELSDPNPQWSTEAVKNFYSNAYPILVAARVDGPRINNDTIEYTFSTSLGTKG